jgi:hypothetical protein
MLKNYEIRGSFLLHLDLLPRYFARPCSIVYNYFNIFRGFVLILLSDEGHLYSS